ncbi:MAG: saccharopine dehydrogenase NADP-binding domain-containing protein [Kofleriaceae bacterium]|nr:saccharopine dehydrogenase NADP-binding domain-containing protein [Kofleriaceae bacterium]
MSGEAAILVFGATGLVGRGVCRALASSGIPFEIAGRSQSALAEVARELPVADGHVADATNTASLAQAFAGARVVVNAAGPLRETAVPVIEAALAAGAHYVDVGGEQAALHLLHERLESTARRSGLVALPGAGLDCTLGDLAAAWAAEHVCGERVEGPAVRSEPGLRLAEDRPLDEVAISYVFDDIVLSAGSQRALFGGVSERPIVWRRDRWEPGRAGERRRVNAGPDLGGERDALGYAAGDAITVPRHLAATLVSTYVSTTRNAGAARALGLLARALPFVPRQASALLAPYAPAGTNYARTRFGVIAQVRRGFSAAQVVVRGHDIYRTTSAITAWCATQLARRTVGPVGIRAPGELFRASSALHELAAAAQLAVEPSFG